MCSAIRSVKSRPCSTPLPPPSKGCYSGREPHSPSTATPHEAPPVPGSAQERHLVAASPRHSPPTISTRWLVGLLTDDAWLAMPPAPHEYFHECRGDRPHSCTRVPLARWTAPARLRPTRANGQPAFSCHLVDTVEQPAGLIVLTLTADHLHGITRFLDNQLQEHFRGVSASEPRSREPTGASWILRAGRRKLRPWRITLWSVGDRRPRHSAPANPGSSTFDGYGAREGRPRRRPSDAVTTPESSTPACTTSPAASRRELCKAGSASMVAFCQSHDIPYRICGKLIVATDQAELPRLAALYDRATANGLPVRQIGPGGGTGARTERRLRRRPARRLHRHRRFHACGPAAR